MIRYQFHESQRSPEKDPLVTWHQGGPWGSSLWALRRNGILSDLRQRCNEESVCVEPGCQHALLGIPCRLLYIKCRIFLLHRQARQARFNVQAERRKPGEAYAYTLEAFFEAVPHFQSNALYFTGESYAGQYLPNIANFVVDEFWPKNKLTQLKGCRWQCMLGKNRDISSVQRPPA